MVVRVGRLLSLWLLLWPAAGGDNVTSAAKCGPCQRHEELRNISLAHIKMQVLEKLGLKHPPNVTGRSRDLHDKPQLRQLMSMYGLAAAARERDRDRESPQQHTPGMLGDQPEQQQQQPFRPMQPDDDDDHAKTERIFAFPQQHPKIRHGWRGQNILFFRFSEKISLHRVVAAQLWVYVRGPIESPINISALKVLRGGGSAEEPSVSPIEGLKTVRPNGTDGSWVPLEVRRLVAEWFKFPRENLGMIVHAVGARDHQVVTDIDDDKVPFLEVHTSDPRRLRTKRTIGLNCDENSEETRCCRFPLTVDFEEFGWDWIIAPKKYEANYCAGDCPYVFLQKYPHTHIVALANPAGTAGPCCAPRKMSAISMLYFDQELNIIYGLLPGMVVDRCGCS